MTKFNVWDFYTREEMINYINDNSIKVIKITERTQIGVYRFTVYGYKEII